MYLKTLDSGLILTIISFWIMQTYNSTGYFCYLEKFCSSASLYQYKWPNFLLLQWWSEFLGLSNLCCFTGKGMLMHLFVCLDLFLWGFVHLLYAWTEYPAWNPNFFPSESWAVHTLVLVLASWRVLNRDYNKSGGIDGYIKHFAKLKGLYVL